jgi:hypothetical protein
MAYQVIKPKRSFTASSIPGTGDLEIGELAMNLTDGKFYSKLNSSTVKEMGGATAIDIDTVLSAGAISTNDLVFNNANIVFEGATADSYETTLSVEDPTGDRTVKLPDSSGTLALAGDILAFAVVFGG